MRIDDLLLLFDGRLGDPFWLSRLRRPGLGGAYRLVGTEGPCVRLEGGGERLELTGGELALLPPGSETTISIAPAAKGFVGVVAFVPDAASGGLGGMDTVLRLLGRQPRLKGQRPLRPFFTRLHELFASQSVFATQAANHRLASFVYDLAEQQSGGVEKGGEAAYVDKALELMNMRLSGDLSLDELSRMACVSEAHFIRMFKKRMHMAPMKYFMRLKIHYAAALVINGMRIREVAERTGFYNEAHFSRQFKKYMGVPPREYRPSHVEELNLHHSENIRSLSFLSNVLANFIDAIPDLVFFKDSFYVYRLCNTAFCDYVGRSREEIYGQTDFNLFPREVAASYRAYDERIINTRSPQANEEWVEYPDGRRFLVEAFKAPYFGPHQEILGIIGVSRDISARA